MSEPLNVRTVFVISDSTGITAETFSHSVLSQFHQFQFQAVRIPFVDTVEKARKVAERINKCAENLEDKPLVFSTLVDPRIARIIGAANCNFFDLFGAFVRHIERALGVKSSRSVGRSHSNVTSEQYNARIDAINFSLAHDDGQFVSGLDQADVIVVGVSRCGKTPTSLYLSMQFAVKVANYPLMPEYFARGSLPSTLAPYRKTLFGLSIHPERLAEVRNERRPNSTYASLEQSIYEITEAERLMRIEGIPWLSTTNRSIEEISTKILNEVGLNRRSY